jgi:hypothetical protein
MRALHSFLLNALAPLKCRKVKKNLAQCSDGEDHRVVELIKEKEKWQVIRSGRGELKSQPED